MQSSKSKNTKPEDKVQGSSAEAHPLPGPEDGHLELPNWLVERLARLQLNGPEWQIIWAVWRHTLCWQRGQWGNHPYPISTDDLVAETGIAESQIKRAIARLVEMNIILRDRTPGGRLHKAMTMFNLDPFTWKKPTKGKGSKTEPLPIRGAKIGPICSQKGSENAPLRPTQPEEKGSKTEPQRVAKVSPFPNKIATLSEAKSRLLKKDIKENKKEKEGPSPHGLGAQTPASKYLFEKTGRKRWQNLVQKEQFEKAESEVGEECMKEAINWALTSGISNIKSIITAARRGGRHEAGRGTKPRGRPQVHQGVTPAYHQTTDEERRRAIT